VLLVGMASAAFVAPPPLHAARRALRVATCMAEEAAADDDGDYAVAPSDMAKLQSRIQKIQEGGLSTPASKLFDLATQKSPQRVMQDFITTSPPMVVTAMQEAVTSLLGQLPPFEFDSQIATTGDKLAALMLQLQMTGYMLRNAEYVMMLRKMLKLRTRSADEYRAAFDRLDTDGSGYIEAREVEELLKEVYEWNVPQMEIEAFMALFDRDGDGRISWEEFEDALGVDPTGVSDTSLKLLSAGDPVSDSSSMPKLSGTITVALDDGGEVQMDAEVYMEQLKEEALALRAELNALEGQKAQGVGTSLSAYVASLSESQLKVLTSGISDDVVEAMKQLVSWILRAPSGDGPLERDAEVQMEQAKLQQLCFYQLILGYQLREAEAKGDANDAIGR